MSTHAARAAALFFAALALFSLALGQSTLWSRDETTYAEIARTMLTSGDWLTLHWNGRPWLNHPPLFYWLMALDFRMLGVNELAARLPAAVFGAAGVSLTYLWGATFLQPRGALVAAAAMMLNVQYFLESRMAIIDTTFLFFLSLTMLGFWVGWRGDRRGWALFFGGCGLACLAKGPWGLVYPFMVVVPFAAWSGEMRRLARIPWLWGLPLTLAIGGSWYVIETLRHGEVFVRVVLGYYFLGRITTTVEHQGGPWWMYVPVLAAGFLPWSFLLPPALRDLWRRRGDDNSRLLLCWIAIPLVGISVATTKLPSYAAFVLMPCALALGAWVDRLDGRRPLALPLGLAGLFSIGLVVAMRLWGESNIKAPLAAIQAGEIAFLLLGAGLLLAVFTALVPSRLPSPLALAATGMLACLLTVVVAFLPALEPERTLRGISAAVRAVATPADRVAVYGPGVFGVIYYADRGPMEEVVDEDALRAWIARTPGGLLVLRAETLEHLPPDLAARLQPQARTPREIIARVM